LLYRAIANGHLFVRLSVCPSVTFTVHAKTVQYIEKHLADHNGAMFLAS